MKLEEYREKLKKDITYWQMVLDEDTATEQQKYALQEIIHVTSMIYHELGMIVCGEQSK